MSKSTENSDIQMNREIYMKVSIIGAGVVGQATGMGLAHHGNAVLFNDIDKNKVASLKNKGYRVTDQILEVVHDSDIIFICVPTPNNDNCIDLTSVNSSIEILAQGLKKTKKYVVLVFRSTVLPQTTRTILIPALEKRSGLKAGKDFGVCMNPEFLREHSSLNDFLNPSRVVIGEFDKKSGDVLENLYSTFNCSIIRTDLDTAEMIKYAANLYLASKISFFNELFMICSELGLDPQKVSETVSLDPRIGKYGICGGTPFGGKCFPKDLSAFLTFAKSRGLSHRILEAVKDVNQTIKFFNHIYEK
ncbi:UDP-glucose/GDP-mannose dehydrogenase family protein [bacterium]|nr:MAG: UDP-glucose/GDP-mannose dehydrogenase family protein [bacterium]